MKRTLHAFVTAALFGAGVLSSVYAQTDVTEQYIVNPGFEAPEDPSTTGVAPILTGWERNYVDGYNWNGCNGDWKTEGERSYGIWRPAIDSDFELSQELTVPNGIYTVTVDMTVSKAGDVSRMNGQRLFAGDTEAYYPASAETPADNGAAYPLSVTARVTNGKLKIGIRTNGGETVGIGWFKVDNFRLFAYEGDEGYLNYCRSQLENLSNEVNNLMQELPLGTATELLNLRDEIEQSVATSEVPEEYEEAIEKLAKAIEEVQPAHELFMELIDKINVEYEQLRALGYPGLPEFEAVYNEMFDVLGDPEAVQTDFEEALERLNAGIKTYRFSEFTEATADSPVDATWMIQSANFTKPGGDPSLSADRVSTGWVTSNVSVNGDFRLNTVNGKNCWNNWSDNFTSMNVYQDLEGMPTGLYRFECYQTNNGPEMTDQHAYITGLGGTSNSPYAAYTFVNDEVGGDFTLNSRWEGPLETGKVLVGTDGKLRIGFASTSNGNGSSGWFCFTDCVLRYYGPGSYSEAMENLLQEAEQLKVPESLLKTDVAVLDEAIKAARSVDVSDPAAADAGMLALNAAMTRTREALQAMASFKSGSYAKALAVAENTDYVYADDLVALMTGVVATMNDWLYVSDTTTVAAYPGMTAELDRYLSFVDAYHACDVYAAGASSDDLRDMLLEVIQEQIMAVDEAGSKIEEANEIMNQYLDFAKSYTSYEEYAASVSYAEVGSMFATLLTMQLEAVKGDIAKIASAKVLFASFQSFCKAYVLGMDCAFDETYDENKRAVLLNECEAERKIVAEDYSNSSEAEERLNKLIGDLRFGSVIPGNDVEITSATLVNPTIEAASNDVTPEGWIIDRTNGNTYSTTSQHWSGVGTDRYLDSWNGTEGALKYTAQQEIRGIPNGTYRLVAAARTSGTGSYLFAKAHDGIKCTEIPLNWAEYGGIWETADADSEIKLANSARGWGWNWVEVADINVNTNSMVIGCSTNSEFTGADAWKGTWFSVDDFKLFYVSEAYYGVGIENVGVDSASDWVAYAENGYIKVEGVEAYTLYTLNGTPVPANAQLTPGIYLVKSGSKVAKVAVK